MSRLRWASLAGGLGLCVVVGVGAALGRGLWVPRLAALLDRHSATAPGHGQDDTCCDHDHDQKVCSHDHGHEGEPKKADQDDDHAHETDSGADAVQLSRQGRQNIGLEVVAVKRQDFERTVAVPGVVVERPGRTETTVCAPMTGIITRIYPIRGAAVSPGAPLFEVRLTHEDLVEKQTALLKSLGELDVIQRDIARLDAVTASGAIAGKTLLERQYEQSKIQAAIHAEEQGLLLHGLARPQIDQIRAQRQLIPSITVVAPQVAEGACCHAHEAFYQVAQLPVKAGDHVLTGTPLATLGDHCELLIEGSAFEQDARALESAAAAKAKLTALVEGDGSARREVAGLELLYVENEVDRQSRALRFYVTLTNELVRNEEHADGQRFIGWRFRPGQRVEILLPLERWKERLVLPIEAVVQEGAESYVYREDGDRFRRQPVHVEYRDRRWAVLGAETALNPGQRVAARGAYQIHLALKNKAGGGVDPHAGHNH